MKLLHLYLTLFLLGLVAYGPMLGAPFLYDDVVTVQNNELLRSNAGLKSIWHGEVDSSGDMNGAFRPALLTFLSFIGRIVGFHPEAMRVASIALHALNALLLFLLARGLWGFSYKWAMTAAIVFLLHPIQITSIGLVWKQSDIWVALAALASLLCLTNGRWFAVGAIFLASLLFKESAIILPVIWLCTEPLQDPARRNKRFFICGVGLVLSYFYYRGFHLLMAPAPSSDANPATHWQYLATQLSLIPVYLKALIWPTELTIDRGVPLATNLLGGTILIFTILSGVIVGCVWACVKRKSRFAAAMLIAAVWLIPTSSFHQLALLYDETRFYLTVGFLAMAGMSLLQPIFTKRAASVREFKLIRVALVCGLLGLLAQNWVQSLRWQSDEALWRAAVEVNPIAPRAHYQLGFIAQGLGDRAEAEKEYRAALRYSPDFLSAHLNLGILVGQQGKLDEAAEHFRALLPGEPAWAVLGHYHLGLDSIYRKKFDSAFEHFATIRRLMPNSAQADRGETVAYTAMGKKSETAAAWRRYLEHPQLKPNERIIAEQKIADLLSGSK